MFAGFGVGIYPDAFIVGLFVSYQKTRSEFSSNYTRRVHAPGLGSNGLNKDGVNANSI